MLDEIVDVIDDTGMEILFSMIDQEQGQTFTITHRSDVKQLGFDSVLQVVRNGGESTVSCVQVS